MIWTTALSLGRRALLGGLASLVLLRLQVLDASEPQVVPHELARSQELRKQSVDLFDAVTGLKPL